KGFRGCLFVLHDLQIGWIRAGSLRRLLGSSCVVIAVVAVLVYFGFVMRMQAKKISNPAPLSAEERELRAELVADVRVLGGEIGERNMARYQQLIGAATFIEDSLGRAGLQPRRDSY